MEVRILGAHNLESSSSRLTTLLIDGVVALDAGALTSALSFQEQAKVEAILLTHCHFDHIRDIAAIAINSSHLGHKITVHSQSATLEAVAEHVLNGQIYPRFTEIPSVEDPTVRFVSLQPLQLRDICGYRVLPVPVRHAVPAVGYQVSSGEGHTFFYTGDAGPGLSSAWEYVAPQLLIVDVTLPNRLEKHAISSGHLTPRLLEMELVEFRKTKGHLPRVMPIHISPVFEDEIAKELEHVVQNLKVDLQVCHEGMKFKV